MGSSGHLLGVFLLLCVCGGTIVGQSRHNVGPCMVYTGRGKVSFNCSQKKLTKIPEEIWSNVTKLDLSHSGLALNLPETQRALQKFQRLTHLNLSANYLPLLARGSLSSLTSLEVLDLSRCQLAEVETGAFEGLPRLQKLFLGHNVLQESAAPALEDLRGVLYLLDVQGNLRLSFPTPHGQQRANRVITVRSSKALAPEQNHEGFEGNLLSSKLNHRKLLAEDPNESITTLTPTTTFNDTTSSRGPAHNWKFLVGVLVAAIMLSITVAVVAKCKLFHRYLASFRHSRFTNVDSVSQCDPDVYEVGFASRGGAGTTSSGAGGYNEEEGEGEDDDGFIEDNYIQPSESERATKAAQHREKEEEEDEDEMDDVFTIG
ncbi:hypothetical protein ACEWY4_014434 [Coilia grayii]|uniref:Uncharacterized protein n=1 Tax=Coilia grayii TaxID=363190 RepID=A0ABD1JSE5_9TELE